jgi:hypothetical protein
MIKNDEHPPYFECAYSIFLNMPNMHIPAQCKSRGKMGQAGIQPIRIYHLFQLAMERKEGAVVAPAIFQMAKEDRWASPFSPFANG